MLDCNRHFFYNDCNGDGGNGGDSCTLFLAGDSDTVCVQDAFILFLTELG